MEQQNEGFKEGLEVVDIIEASVDLDKQVKTNRLIRDNIVVESLV